MAGSTNTPTAASVHAQGYQSDTALRANYIAALAGLSGDASANPYSNAILDEISALRSRRLARIHAYVADTSLERAEREHYAKLIDKAVI